MECCFDHYSQIILSQKNNAIKKELQYIKLGLNGSNLHIKQIHDRSKRWIESLSTSQHNDKFNEKMGHTVVRKGWWADILSMHESESLPQHVQAK